MFKPRHLLVIATILSTAHSLTAQTIVCLPTDAKAGADCHVTVRTASIALAVRIDVAQHPIEGASVTFDGPGTFSARTVVTTAGGIAAVVWDGGAPPTSPDTIRVTAAYRDWVVTRRLILEAPKKPFTITDVVGDSQAWFAGHQARQPVAALIKAFDNDSAACSAVSVVFKALGDGSSVPDTVSARIEGNAKGASVRGCRATTHWKLGPTVGEQFLRVSGGDDPPKLVQAVARHMPWLAAGLAVTSTSGYVHIATSQADPMTTTIAVTDPVTKTVTTTATTKTPNVASVDTIKRQSLFSPIVGVNTPLFTRYPWLRVSVAADAKKLDSEWFAGVSVPQLFRGLLAEDMDIDVQFMVHFERRTVLTNPESCHPQAAPDLCNKDIRIWPPVGAGLSVQFNSSGLIGTFTGFFK